MIQLKTFAFNPFQENTYIIWDATLDAVIIDPGCSNSQEEQKMVDFIEKNKLKPTRLVNTHCHIDHILGNDFIASKYKLPLEIHQKDAPVLASGKMVAQQYGIPYKPSPEASLFLKEGTAFKFGESTMEIFFTPGHSPGSICFYSKASEMVIVGDVLFYGSIGRTDLPGGDHATLIDSIKTQLLDLPSETKVYPGHGIPTKIGFEKENNPFL